MAEQFGPVITLPNAQEIMERLKKVDDDAYTAQTFFPLIAQAAGHELVAQGLVSMLTFKIHDYVSSGYPPEMANTLAALLHMNVPDYIDALVDDKEVAERAKQIHEEVILKRGNK